MRAAAAPPPLRGGCPCAAAPRPTAAIREPPPPRGASRRRSVACRAPPPAATRPTCVAAAGSFPPLLRAAGLCRHTAGGAGARRASVQGQPPRIGVYRCKLPFTSVNSGLCICMHIHVYAVYKCNLPHGVSG